MSMGALMHPLFLARALASTLVVFVMTRASFAALTALRTVNAPAGSEEATRTARQAEIVSAAAEVALVAAVLGVFSLVLAAQRIYPALSGAMCAYGVFDATPWGFFALFSALFLSFASVAWLVLHRLDLALRAPLLTTTKLFFALMLAPLSMIDWMAHIAFSTTLDLSATVSCCSSTFDALVTSQTWSLSRDARNAIAFASVVLVVTSIVGSIITRIRSSLPAAVAASAAGVIASLVAMVCVVTYIAPHAYEMPTHSCPFCLLGELGHYLGWPLLITWWLGTASACGLAVLAWGAHKNERIADAALTHARQIAAASAVAWTLFLLIASIPVVRFALATHGADLFGGQP